MKKYLVLVICSFLLAGPVAALTRAEIWLRAMWLLLEAESRAMEQCGTTRIVVPLPKAVSQVGRKVTEGTADTTVSIEWSGACVDGKRDGEGVLNWIEEKTDEPIRTIVNWRSEGRFVKGQRLGLWCTTRQFRLTREGTQYSEGGESGCSILAGHAKPLTGSFQKQTDGSWMEYVLHSPTGTTLAAGTLEAHSAKVLADAAGGKTDLKVGLVVQSQSLDDLVPGSKIMLAPSTAPMPSTAPIMLKDKRVAIVLSSGTIKELERFRRERQALITASSGLTGDAAEARARFIATSSPDRLLVNVAKTLRNHAGTVRPDDDLVNLKKGQFDYALVIDWKQMTRFDLLGKYDSFPNYSETQPDIAPACESLGVFLIGPDLKAIKVLSHYLRCRGKVEYSFATGDHNYMLTLAHFFEDNWGKETDDTGALMISLEYFLKH